MPTDLENSLRRAAERVAKYVEDAAELSVNTYYVELESHGDPALNKPKLGASSVIKLDGDSDSTVPTRRDVGDRLEVDTQLYALHQQNVTTAIEYRARMMAALLETLGVRRR